MDCYQKYVQADENPIKVKDLTESIIKILVFPKNSEDYNRELIVLSKASKFNKKTIELLMKFDHIFSNISPQNSEKILKSLPNLFSGSIESNDYIKYLNVMYDVSKSKLLSSQILDYLVSYFDTVDLSNESCIRNHHMITILYMLLYFYYGENGTNFINKGHENDEAKKKTISYIEKYLSDLDDSLEGKLEANFLKTCEFLKKLLHHEKYSILNFKSRDICQHFAIKLDLSLMIRLCINGVKQENEDIENLVLFIGNSGSGKSTTINYLYGIQYKLVCSRKTQKYYLKQVDENVIAPAKVGHGNISETLYPKIIKKGELSFCDFPGFNDTRDETYKACASLGLPIAVHYAKNRSIGVIVVVIDWETITLLRGDELLKTIKTVQSLMKDVTSSVKLLYAITRPPIPPDNESWERDDSDGEIDYEADYCASKRIVENVGGHLSSHIKKLSDEFESLEFKAKDETNKILKNISDLQSYKRAFDKFAVGSSFESHAGHSGWKILKFFDSSGVIEKGSNALTKQAILKDIVDDNLSPEIIERIEKFIDHIFQELENKKVNSSDSKAKNNHVEYLTKIEMQKLNEEIDECKKKIEKIEKTLEEKKNLLEFLKNIKTEDIYIIRGFKLKNKWEDHKEDILKRIKEICLKNNEQSDKASFQIDGTSEQFSVVSDWTKNESKFYKTMLNELIAKIDKIEKLKKTISELDQRINEDEKNLRLALVSSRENENKIIQNLQKILQSLQEKKETTDSELKQTTQDIINLQKSLKDIEDLPPIDHRSHVLVKKRNFLTRSLKFQTWYTYKFPRVYYEKPWNFSDWFWNERKPHNLPIDRVELSCLINGKEKIVFKTPLAQNPVDNKNISYNTIVIEDNVIEKSYPKDQRIRIIKNGKNTDFKFTGEFKILENNLSEGFFKVEYTSFEGKDVFAGFRCFVKPIHFPDNKFKIEEFRKNIKEKQHYESTLKIELEDLERDIKENTEHFECAKKGLYDAEKGKHLLKLLLDLEYSVDEFIAVLMQEINEENIKDDIEWLEKDENFKKLKMLFVKYDKIKDNQTLRNTIDFSQIPKKLLREFVFGKEDENTIEKEIEELKKVSFNLAEFDFERLLRLYRISSKSGISFSVLRTLVKSLKSGDTHRRYLKKALNDEKQCLESYEKSLKEKKELFEKRKWIMNILNIVVEVLHYKNLDDYIELNKAKDAYDAKLKEEMENMNNTEGRNSVNINFNENNTELKKSNNKTTTIKQNSSYKILCIDGGGVRGIIPALILDRLEKISQKPICKLFNMISGTSTGAIIAAMLSLPSSDENPHEPKYSAEQAVDFYKSESSRIFESKSFGQYSNSNLKDILIQCLNGAHLSCALVDLIIPAVNEADIQKTHLFESRKAKQSQRENWDIFDAIMATTAAPTFFQPHKIEDLGCFVDGGLRANNPTLTAYTRYRDYVKYESEDDKRNVFVLSIGTGNIPLHETGAQNDDSLLFWAQNATRYAISGQAADVDRQMRALLDNHNYVRLQVDLKQPVSLDNYRMLDELEVLTLEQIDEWERDGTFDLIIRKLLDLQ